MNKVLLILADGMRPDSLAACGHPFFGEMLKHGVYYPGAQTVMPSVTLPCHMSLFHGVSAERHGILTNIYVPQVRPVCGLCEVLHAAGKRCAFFYNWEPLRDLARPGSLSHAFFTSGDIYGYETANDQTAEAAKVYLSVDAPDFAFVYFGWPDAAGHSTEWMGEEYLRAVRGCWDKIEMLCRALSDDYLVIVTADHGGHGRTHGSDMPEDMTIPILLWNRSVVSSIREGGNIIDIAPTVTSILDVAANGEWEGKTLEI